MKLSKSERKIFRQQLGLEFQKIRRRKKLSLEDGALCQKMKPLRLAELEEHGRKFMNMRLSRLLEMADNYDYNLNIRLTKRLNMAAK